MDPDEFRANLDAFEQRLTVAKVLIFIAIGGSSLALLIIASLMIWLANN